VSTRESLDFRMKPIAPASTQARIKALSSLPESTTIGVSSAPARTCISQAGETLPPI
jgi:hypothetical protein